MKLAGCVNITGDGLGILRGSVVLEQIDLSILGRLGWHESPVLRPKSLISEEVVLPILALALLIMPATF